MAPFYPLFVRRSDGKVSVKNHKGVPELNEPLPEQLDTKANAQGLSDFYREAKPGDVKEVDWRRKLGGMLMREIGGSERTDRNYILAALPEGYRVYEHVKCRLSEVDDKDKIAKVGKNHAGGGNERQDAYLYGHPIGRKKRYRSPAEFFPHLLWLATDETGDSSNCSCKFCSPEELAEEKPPPKVAVKEVKPISTGNTPEVQTKPNIVVSVPPRPPTQSAPSVPAQSTKESKPPQLPPSIPLPQYRNHEQEVDAQYNSFVFRPGEVVWFSRGQAWGLAVVVQRSFRASYTDQHRYTVQPLSHPFGHRPLQSLSQTDLRPWLAWSPPPCTCKDLNPTEENNHRILTYDTVNWQGVMDGAYGPGDAEVDGSILAVKKVETSYTLFDQISSATSTFPASYNGLFFGGEKIWVGDPVRPRHSSAPTDMIILHQVLEQRNDRDPSRPIIVLVGDVYSFKTVSFEANRTPNIDAHLPPRVLEDLKYRNEITNSNTLPSTRRYTASWQLSTKAVRLGLADIKGRWYESSIVLPLIDRDTFANARAQGEIHDSGVLMNGQGDCNRFVGGTGAGAQTTFKPADNRAVRREDAFGKSVPTTLRIQSSDRVPEKSSTAHGEASTMQKSQSQPLQQPQQAQQPQRPQQPQQSQPTQQIQQPQQPQQTRQTQQTQQPQQSRQSHQTQQLQQPQQLQQLQQTQLQQHQQQNQQHQLHQQSHQTGRPQQAPSQSLPSQQHPVYAPPHAQYNNNNSNNATQQYNSVNVSQAPYNPTSALSDSNFDQFVFDGPQADQDMLGGEFSHDYDQSFFGRQQ